MYEVIVAILGNGALVGAVFLIIKVWFEKSLDAANVREIERLRTELRLVESRTTRFDERRFEALNEIYVAMAAAIDAFDRWTRMFRAAGAPSEEEDGQRAVEAYDSLMRKLNENRLWLGKDLANDAAAVRDALHQAWAGFAIKDARDWKKVRSILDEQLPPLRHAFEERAESLLTRIEGQRRTSDGGSEAS